MAKIILKDGYGFWGLSGTHLSNSNLSNPPPPPGFIYSVTFKKLAGPHFHDVAKKVLCDQKQKKIKQNKNYKQKKKKKKQFQLVFSDIYKVTYM